LLNKKKYQYNYRKNEEETIVNKDLFNNDYETVVNKGKREGTEYLIICED
jgi:hypothetical protein